MIGLLVLMAIAGSSRFVQLVSVKDHTWHPAPHPRTRPHRVRLAHAALLLLVLFWPASPSQAPVRTAPAAAVEAGDDATFPAPRPCMYAKRMPGPAVIHRSSTSEQLTS